MDRVWLSRGAAAQPLLRIMQWNMLAQDLTKSSPTENFFRTPPHVLEWEHRKSAIVEHITKYMPDIACIEENDRFFELADALRPAGYCGVFSPKVSDPASGFAFRDGVSMLWNTSTVRMLNSVNVNFIDNVKQAVSSQVASIGIFEHIASSQQICVAGVHLKAKKGPENENLRVQHVKQLVQALKSIESSYSLHGSIVCGDFNDEPLSLPVQEMAEHGFFSTMEMWYKKEVPFTTAKSRPNGESVRTIDYIFTKKQTQNSEKRAFEVCGVLSLPFDRSSLPKDLLPCSEFPSDHFSLVADFVIGE